MRLGSNGQLVAPVRVRSSGAAPPKTARPEHSTHASASARLARAEERASTRPRQRHGSLTGCGIITCLFGAKLTDRTWRGGLAVVTVVALVLRVGLLLVEPKFHLIFDPADYELHGASIALGHGYPPTQIASAGTPSAFRPPAYPYLLGAVYALFGIHPNLGRLVGALLGTLTVLLVALLGSGLWSRRIGLISGSVAAVCPSLIVLNGSLLSESLFLPIELALALAVLAFRSRGADWRVGLAIGALCGLAALTRTVGIVLLVPSLWAIGTVSSARRTRISAGLAAVVACALVLTPWTIRNAEVFHAFVPLNTQGGLTLAGQYNVEAGRDNSFQAVWRDFPTQTPQLAKRLARFYFRPGGINEVQLNGRLTDAAFSYISAHPSEVLFATALNSLRLFGLGKNHQFTTGIAYNEMNVPHAAREITTLTIQLIALIGILGLIASLTGRLEIPLGPWQVWAIPLLAIAATVPEIGTPRYRVILDPFLILLAVRTVIAIGLKVRPGRTPVSPR